MAARRFSMTTCVRCGRCLIRRGRFSARSTGRARSASSISGSPRRRSRSAMARRARAGSWSAAWATRARAPGRWCFPRRSRTCCSGSGAVYDRQAGLHAGGGRPTEAFAAFCGQLRVGWHFCERGDPQAKGVVERLQDFMERSFEPGRIAANELDYQLQLDGWFDERANPRMHKTLRCRPIDRLIEERQVMAPLPQMPPDVDRRWVLRVPPDPYLRFNTNDYSLDPALVG